MREQKKRQARQALERAALDLFDQRGYDETTIKDIAQAAGLSPRTFFRYFDSKQDVVFAVERENFAVMMNLLRENEDRESLLDMLRNTMYAYAKHLESRPPDEIGLRARLVAGSAELRRRLADEFQGWQEEISHHIASVEGAAREPRHIFLAGVALQALTVAGTTWAGDRSRSLTRLMEDLFADLEKAVNGASPIGTGGHLSG